MERKKGISQGWALVIVIIVAVAGLVLWATEDHWRPAAAVPYLDTHDTVTLTFSDERSGGILNPVVTLKGPSYTVKKTATGGSAEFTAVPRGSYTVETELTGIYDYTTTTLIRSTEKTVSKNFTLDNIGTFSWAETAATATIASENDQIVILRVYLNNSAKDTVINDLRVKLVSVVDSHENIDIEDLECTSHSFEEDDLTAEKWIISGSAVGGIGDIEGETTTTVTYRVTLDVNDGIDNTLVFTASVQDLDGDSPETSASKTITWTVA